VTELQLKNRGAGEILEIARPLLGLEPGQNANDQLRISVGLLDDRIYVTGQPVKVGLLKSLVERADKPLTSPDADAETEAVTPVFKTHPVSTADSTTVFDVLQTLLAGTPDARITIEPNTKAIIAFARPETHKMIADTIAELEGRGRELQIFKLRRLDPAQALLTINKFFGVTDDGGSGPTVDGNPDDGKLWVRGTREQIDMVANLLDQLEGDESFGALGDKVRLLNVNNAEMQDALQRAIMLWPITGRSNAIRQLPSTTDAESATDNPPAGGDIKGDSPAATDAENPFRQSQPELTDAAMRQAAIDPAIRLVNENQQAAPETKTAVVDSKKAVSETPATGNPAMTPEIRVPTGSGADIIIQMTPAGLMIASEDTDALDEFEALLESLSGQAAPSDEPKIFWLKHAEAEPTAEFISQILGGAEGSLGSVVDSATSSLGGGMLGGLMSLAGGGGGGGDESSAKSVLTASGSVSIVPDARLNALVVQANPADLSLIQLLIDKFDVADSPEDIQFRARPRVLQVIYQDAGEIATVVKEVMGDRIAGQEQKNARGGGGQPDPREIFAALRGGNRAKSEKTKSEAPKISIAVDKKSNTLVVVASPQDYEEVEELVRELDEAGASLGETTVTIAAPGGVNGEAFVKALEALSGNSVNSESGKSAGNTTESSSSSQNAGSAAEIQRRIEFFRSRFGGGTPGGAPGGRGGAASGRGSSGRGGPGGGARGGGGGPRGGRGGR
ncbi:MAG: secretin N-terminal domain-containing protein, partial [Planctomycetota bacterium]